MNPKPDVAPGSDVRVPNNAVPEAVQKKIRNGWIAAMVSGVSTLLAVVLAVTTGTMGNVFDAWNMIDVALTLVLAFGIGSIRRAGSLQRPCSSVLLHPRS